MLVALMLLSWALMRSLGFFDAVALVLVLAAAAVVGMGLVAGREPASRWMWVVCGAGCALSMAYLSPRAAVLLAALAGAALARPSGRPAWIAIAGAVAVTGFVTANGWVWGTVGIDVFDSVQRASFLLLHGHNPYDATFTTLIPGPADRLIGRTIHYQYGPTVALLAAPGRALGDVRSTAVLAAAAVVACAAILGRRHNRERMVRVLAIGIALPVGAVMVRNAWVDVYMMATFAGWVVLRDRSRLPATVLLALSLAAKPTIVPALVPWFLWSSRARRETLPAALLALVIGLPFIVLTGPAQLYRDIVGVQIDMGTRVDALTINSYLHQLGIALLPTAIFVVIVGLTTIAALRRRPVTYGDMLTSAALIYVVSFVLAKWAFFNYYYLPVCLLLLAVAGGRVRLDPDDVRLPFARQRGLVGHTAAVGITGAR